MDKDELLQCPAVSQQAFVAVIAKTPRDGCHWQLGIASWGVGGYSVTDYYYQSQDAAKAAARDMNANLGLTETQGLAIALSSMRVPGCRERRR